MATFWPINRLLNLPHEPIRHETKNVFNDTILMP